MENIASGLKKVGGTVTDVTKRMSETVTHTARIITHKELLDVSDHHRHEETKSFRVIDKHGHKKAVCLLHGKEDCRKGCKMDFCLMNRLAHSDYQEMKDDAVRLEFTKVFVENYYKEDDGTREGGSRFIRSADKVAAIWLGKTREAPDVVVDTFSGICFAKHGEKTPCSPEFVELCDIATKHLMSLS